jgi:itaconate CoA-transferase
MDNSALYKSKLKSAADAVADVPSGTKLAMGMAVAEPPALLNALAKRAEAGSVGGLQSIISSR